MNKLFGNKLNTLEGRKGRYRQINISMLIKLLLQLSYYKNYTGSLV